MATAIGGDGVDEREHVRGSPHEPLVRLLRELGVAGDEDDLEDLLEHSGLDVQRAANLYFDRQQGLGAGCDGERAADDASEDEAEGTAVSSSACHLRSRDRRRVQRHGGAGTPADESVAALAAPKVAPKAPKGLKEKLREVDKLIADAKEQKRAPGGSEGTKKVPKERNEKVVKKRRDKDIGRSEVRSLPIGKEGYAVPTGVRFSPMMGMDLEIDVTTMTQVNVETGEVVEVRRKRNNCSSSTWTAVYAFATERGARLDPYPKEVSRDLERIWLELKGQSAASGARSGGAWSDCTTRVDEEAPAAPAEAPDGGAGGADVLARAAAWEAQLGPGEMDAETRTQTLETLFCEAERTSRLAPAAAELLRTLSQRQGLRCAPACARRAGLIVGSMVLLQAVLQTDPDMHLVGVEVFDKRYPGIKLNERGRKNGIRSLLARGMKLGAQSPSSKLLHKVEADSVPLWQDRYFESVLHVCPALPEQAVTNVRAFLA